ncbi:MAG TPA: histidine kinase dimerization/phospho-acceptor domain-containing protein, partial [Spirochaetales bacterium]|nr:histidine kinase dimerization/phospho-acceptor domain-containing protein [Spirochaetales bacterium]
MRRPRVPIVARILGVNALLVFLPVAAFLSLDTYERSLLSALEDSLVQQGRFLAAWLGEGELSASRAEAVLAALGRRHTARLRVLDAAGNLLADSSVRPPDAPPSAPDAEAPYRAGPDVLPEAKPAESSWIYRLLSGPVRLWRRYLAPPSEPLASADFYTGKRNFLEGAEVRAALEGRYGAATRISAGGQVSVTLYSALPVPSPDGTPRGAVLASQSTYRILAGLYRLRLDVGRIFLAGLAASSALSLLLWLTISRPLRRLGIQARAALSLRGLAEGHFKPGAVSDEIGDLGSALREFSARLGERLSWAEDFASDLSHEIRNPLASIRAAAELLPDAGPEEVRILGDRIARDADRAARIVGGLRELSRIEGGEDGTGPADVLAVARNCARFAADRSGSGSGPTDTRITVEAAPDAGELRAAVSPDRLALALGALL